jgi:hypothetical protein
VFETRHASVAPIAHRQPRERDRNTGSLGFARTRPHEYKGGLSRRRSWHFFLSFAHVLARLATFFLPHPRPQPTLPPAMDKHTEREKERERERERESSLFARLMPESRGASLVSIARLAFKSCETRAGHVFNPDFGFSRSLVLPSGLEVHYFTSTAHVSPEALKNPLKNADRFIFPRALPPPPTLPNPNKMEKRQESTARPFYIFFFFAS